MRAIFQISGESGGLLSWGSDTVDEFRANFVRELTAAGARIVAFDLTWSDVSISDRLLHNSFPYRATVTLDATMITNDQQFRDLVATAATNASGGNVPTAIARLDQGDSSLPDPSGTAAIRAALPGNLSLGLIAIIVVGAVLVLKEV